MPSKYDRGEVDTKQCSECKEVKQVGIDFSWRRDKAGNSYPYSACRVCMRGRQGKGGKYILRGAPRPKPPEGMAHCGRCQEYLPKANFSPSAHSNNGVAGYCRLCANEIQVARRAAFTPEQRQQFMERKRLSNMKHLQTRQAWRLENYFNITAGQYEEMLAEQGGVCAICSQSETKKRNGVLLSLAVDHDHKCCPTKAKSCGACIRGLICSSCNHGLGNFRDDEAVMLKAISYLQERSVKEINL